MSARDPTTSGGAQHPHDLISYRDTGELSDLTVVLDSEHEMKLHRFPLYTKSDYFRERAGDSRVELPGFPGGADCFARVADFCYGKRIDIGPENCVQLNCAARRLGMTGRDNLADLTERYLEEVLRSAQLTRSMGPVVDLLVQAAELGVDACGDGDKSKGEGEGDGQGEGDGGGEGEDVKAASTEPPPPPASVAERCFAMLLDAWTRPGLGVGSGGVGVGVVGERLLRLPLDWFARLIRAAEAGGQVDSERQRRALAELSARYLHRVFLRDAHQEKKAAEEAEEKQQQEQHQAGEQEEEAEAKGKGSDAEADEPSQRQQQRKMKQEDEERQLQQQFEPKEPAGEVLDRVVLTLPEATPLAEVISADWIQRALRVSEKFGCQCRGRLLQLAGNTLHRFRQDELHQMTSTVLCDIVSSSVRNKGVQPEVLSCVIDNHLLDLARAGSLDADDFVKLAACVPAEYRASHDALYEVAETLLAAGESIPDEKQKEVIDTVDLSRCDVATLQRALDKGAIPVKTICQAGIDLAKRLKQQQQQQADHSGRSSTAYRLRDEPRSSSQRFPVGVRRYDPLAFRQHQFSGSGSVHYTDPYAAAASPPYGSPLNLYDDEDDYRGGGSDSAAAAAASASSGRYTAHDYDVDLLLLEAERSAQRQQQQQPPVDYRAGRRTRKW